ncbi:sensor histidine kinase [Kamptonema formosum]|uniref:sensor histidine kinase n=1 Tax=Kamptonema formosum TaxID=331992 RepID=UPI000345D794|nr:PAS domain S-box protein [Oscillatoria sp. PCC 10802]
MQLLLVEDNRADAVMLQEILTEDSAVPVRLTVAKRLTEAIERLEADSFDIILLDLSLPDTQGLDTLLQVQERAPSLPIVVMTGTDSEELAVEAVRKGAQDYLVKGQVDGQQLMRAMRYAIERKHTLEALRDSEERFRLLVAGGKDYAIFTLCPEGRAISWNPGAERILGYRAEEILGEHFSRFYVAEDIEAGLPQQQLQTAAVGGRFEGEGWRRRKDGSRYWAAVTVTALRDENGQLRGFAKVIRDLSEPQRAETEIRKLHEDLKRRAGELEVANKELEAFNYSVSHDLRNPLSIIDGMSWALLQQCADRLDERGKHYLDRIRAACKRMQQLIEDLLHLSRVSRSEMQIARVDLSQLAQKIAQQLQQAQPERQVEIDISAGVAAAGDECLLQIALENLLGNAWKYTGKKPVARISFGVTQERGETVYFVRDTGAGFDMESAGQLFVAFRRLHKKEEFDGTGIGLATVERIIHRHGGRIWAEAEVGAGATFYFTLAEGK